MEKKVAITILTMNKKHLIDDCLSTLRKNTSYKNYRTIVVDNASTDGTAELIKKKFKWVDLIVNNENLGFARGQNVGIKFAVEKYDPDYVFLLNDDTQMIQKDWLTKMVEAAESDYDVGIVGCRLIYSDGKLQFFAKNHEVHLIQKNDPREYSDEGIIQDVNSTIGATFLIKKRLIDKIGLIDPGYYPIYGDEIDYCERAKKNGFKIRYTPYATIVHLGAQTIDPKKSLKVWELQKRASIRLELINYSIPQIIYWQAMHLISVFFKREAGSSRSLIFKKDFIFRIPLLIRAYFYNFSRIGEILYRRAHVHEKIWY